MDLMELLFELLKNLPRAGPGNNESTRKVFSMLYDLPPSPKILDIGCGPGMQTIELAKISNGKIVALDIHQPFLDRLLEKAQTERVEDKIEIKTQSMFEMSFEEKIFDIIWVEGAIFIIGFETGLRAWRKFLKEQGFIVISELAWLKKELPTELKEFFEAEYPAIKFHEENIEIIKNIGYNFVNSFILPEEGWWVYYEPLTIEIESLRRKYKTDQEKLSYLTIAQKEIDLYKKYSSYYGYIFYIIRD
ncbi:MAG TPA: class I SAM-dependent methyltransferase [Candidatus Deferrimicrobium sp.]|nr:class I SAM-dependent methyltransferase [Candidatus Deferrimicrobium sp.]